MNTRGNPRLREMLAAEYALGTMRGGARRRFERWTRSDDELRTLALEWSERLAPLIDSIPSTAPRRRVWEAIEARLPGFAARHGSAEAMTGVAAWWDRLALWRGLSAAFAAVAVIAIGLAVRPPTVVEPRIVQVPVQVMTPPAAIATLVDPKSGAPVAVVMAEKGSDVIEVRVAANVDVPKGKVLQLWVARTDVDGVQPMGVLPSTAGGAATSVQPLPAASLLKVKAFGLSLEPAGGSQTPTQVLGLGPLIRLPG
jgi:anti-sigma-K factor RskA